MQIQNQIYIYTIRNLNSHDAFIVSIIIIPILSYWITKEIKDLPKTRNRLNLDFLIGRPTPNGHYDFASVVIPSAWIEECNHELKWDNDKMTSKAPSVSTSSYAVMVMINIMFFNSRLHQAILIEG